MNISTFELTRSQKTAYFHARSGKNVFISGVAGTGKTWLLKHLSELLGKPVELYATCGIAAINLGGVTVSSNSGLKLFGYEDDDETIKNRLGKGYLREGTVVVIDEIGFLSEEQFRLVDVALRGCGKSKELFGGYQVIIAGDFKQMPNIGWGISLEKGEYLKQFRVVELVENVRQREDAGFFTILNDTIRYVGVTPEVVHYLQKNHNPFVENATTLVATRSLMDRLNSKVETPRDFEEFFCPVKDVDRPYETIKIWEGMPVIITKNNNRAGYCNGDTGVITSIESMYQDDEENSWDEDSENSATNVRVRLNRTGTEVWVIMASRSFSYVVEKIKIKTTKNSITVPTQCTYEMTDESFIVYKNNVQIAEIKKGNGKHVIEILSKESYQYMPLLPAFYLSPRRVQGLTLTHGIIHESILYAHVYNSKDAVNIQYVAFSRFTNLENVKVSGIEKIQKYSSRILNIL
jgi:hypothetical protein